MSRSLSPESNPVPTRQNTEDGRNPQPKRRRGRPLEVSNDGRISKRRRSQVRRAQEAFRRRKEAATKSLEQRVGLLEECIEQISNQFVEFTDYLCQSSAIRQDQQLLRHSLVATSKILNLAQQANSNLSSEDGLAGESEAGLDLSANHRNKNPSPWGHEAAGTTKSKTNELSSQQIELQASTRARTPDVKMLSSIYLPLYGIYYTDDVLGDAWALGPNPLTDVNRDLISTELARGERMDSFGSKLIQSTLNIAYKYLLGESNASAALATHMFRFALLHRSREEILYKMRWFLGPGLQYLPSLGHAFILPEDVEDLWETFCRADYPTDRTEIEDGGFESIASFFLSAFGVENYLETRGAIYMDDDTIIIKVPNSDSEGVDNDSPAASLHSFTGRHQSVPEGNVTPASPTPQDSTKHLSSGKAYNSTFQDKDMAQSQPSPLKHPQNSSDTNSPWDFIGGFSFDWLLPTAGLQSMMIQPDSSWVSQASRYNDGVVTVSVPHLVQIITHNSLCLGNGPGYPRSAIDYVFNALTTQRLEL